MYLSENFGPALALSTPPALSYTAQCGLRTSSTWELVGAQTDASRCRFVVQIQYLLKVFYFSIW